MSVRASNVDTYRPRLSDDEIDDSTDYECAECGKLNYKPWGCANCGAMPPASLPGATAAADRKCGEPVKKPCKFGVCDGSCIELGPCNR